LSTALAQTKLKKDGDRIKVLGFPDDNYNMESVIMTTFKLTAKSVKMLQIYRSTRVEAENEYCAIARFAAMVGMTIAQVQEKFKVEIVPI
jgi:hypothetical protein